VSTLRIEYQREQGKHQFPVGREPFPLPTQTGTYHTCFTANLHLVPTETNGSIGLLAWAGELQFSAVTFLGYLLYRLMTLGLLGIGACPSSSVVLSLERRKRCGLISSLVWNEQVGCHVACERLGRMSSYQSRDSCRPDGSRSAKRMLRGAARRLHPFGIFCVSRRMISRSSGS
jgi:hypothetical protein